MTACLSSTDGDLNTMVRSIWIQKAGDISFEDLYNQSYKSVYKICLRMLANASDAEDLTHDTLLQVQRKLSSFRGDSAFSSWLHRITVNQVLMHFRKRSTRCEQTTFKGDIPEPSKPYFNRPNSVSVIDRIALATAIEKLPPGYRAVFLLHDVEGYAHSEIARTLGFTDGTSKSQLHKARRQMRALLLERIESN
jgi:RNA polymerase sigma-70 factor, ECF subfamily